MTRRIIDLHVHAYGGDEGSPDPRFGTEITNPLTGDVLTASADPQAHLKQTLDAFDEVGIVKAVASPGTPEGVAAMRAADPERILVGAYTYRPHIEALRSAHAAGELHMLGEITAQYAGLRPGDESLAPIFDLAVELDVPVGYHMYAGGPPGRASAGMAKMRIADGDPTLFEDVLEHRPQLRLCIMHAGWPLLSELLGMLYAYSNVYVDLGVIAWCQPRAEFHAYLKRITEAGYTDRVMFGSDQMVWPQTIGIAVQAVEDAGFLSEAAKQAIFHDNACGFLRL